LRRAIRKAGNRCGVCRRRLSSVETTAVGYLGGRLVLAADACCAAKLSEIWGGSLWVGPPPWQTDDAAWFAANRGPSHRLRPAMAGEIDGAGWVVVQQIEPGRRRRRDFNPPAPPPDDETIAHAVFDALAAAIGAGRDHVTPAEIAARVAQLSGGGRA
jgi:hypothetical protein